MSIFFHSKKGHKNFRNVRLFLSCSEMVGKHLLIWGQVELFSQSNDPNNYVILENCIFVHILHLIKLLLAMFSASCLLLTGGIS
jgi:hypothetical protein